MAALHTSQALSFCYFGRAVTGGPALRGLKRRNAPGPATLPVRLHAPAPLSATIFCRHFASPITAALSDAYSSQFASLATAIYYHYTSLCLSVLHHASVHLPSIHIALGISVPPLHATPDSVQEGKFLDEKEINSPGKEPMPAACALSKCTTADQGRHLLHPTRLGGKHC